MSLRIPFALAASIAMSVPLAAQSLASRVTSSDGIVQIVYPSRPSACGDGQSFIGNLLGNEPLLLGRRDVVGAQRLVDAAVRPRTGARRRHRRRRRSHAAARLRRSRSALSRRRTNDRRDRGRGERMDG